MFFSVRILGANSAVPNKNRFPTSQCISIGQEKVIIDCGEGSQINLSTYKIKRGKINHILISHLHGDHVYGLPGLLSSLNLGGRTAPLILIGPLGIKEFIESVLRMTHVNLQFPLEVKELNHSSGKKLIESSSLIDISAFPLKHRVPTFGYLLSEKKWLNIKSEAIESYKLDIAQIKAVKNGEAIISQDGKTIPNAELAQWTEPRSYAYCSDTIYDPQLTSYIQGVDLLYHEATYLHELKDKAIQHKHSTALEAGQIAKAAKVNKLIIGHYSSRYDDLQPLENEARTVFSNTQVVRQGDLFSIDFK